MCGCLSIENLRLEGEVDLTEEDMVVDIGDPVLTDALFIERGILTLIFGHAFTGKTTLALAASINEAANAGRVFYIDTENGVSPARVRKLLSARGITLDAIKGKLKLIRAFELREVLGYAGYAMKMRYSLIVIDSISRVYLAESRKRDREEVAHDIYVALNDLQRRAAEEGATIILTSETCKKQPSVVDLEGLNPHQLLALNESPWPMEALGSLAKIAIGLLIVNGRRYAYVERHRSKPSIYEDLRYYEFKIVESGLKYVGSVEFMGSKVAYRVPVSSPP